MYHCSKKKINIRTNSFRRLKTDSANDDEAKYRSLLPLKSLKNFKCLFLA